MVEQLTLNQLVPGSSPGGATKLVFFPNSFAFALKLLGRCSSTVEHLFCKQAVAGSNPIAGSSSSRLARKVACPKFRAVGDRRLV